MCLPHLHLFNMLKRFRVTDKPINAVSQHSLLSKRPQRCDRKGGGVKKNKKLTRISRNDERVGGRDLFFLFSPSVILSLFIALLCKNTQKSRFSSSSPRE